MATMTNASVFLSMRSEEIKKVIYDFDIRGRKYSLVRVYIDGVLTQKVALSELGYNISTPSTIQFLEEIIEESK